MLDNSLNEQWIELGSSNVDGRNALSVDLSTYRKIALLSIGASDSRIYGMICVPISIFRNRNLFVPTAGQYNFGVHAWYVDENTIEIGSEKTDTYAYLYGIK